jgi:membrane protein
VPLASAALPYVARPFSLAIGTVLLTLTYKLVPARQVPLRAALISGFLAAVALEGAKFGFALYITNVRTYEIVYGALAALPLFLIWIYVCWIILLAGAAVAATLAEHRWGRSKKRRRP